MPPLTASPAAGGGNPYYPVTGSFTATSLTAPLVVRNHKAADSARLVVDFRIMEPDELAGDLDSLNATGGGSVLATALQPNGKC